MEFYDNLDELPEKIYARYCDFNVDEEVQMYLDAKANGLEGVPGVVELTEDVQEEERLIGILSDTVSAGLSGKIPGPKRNWMEKEREFDVKLSEAYSDPSNPITEAVMKELDKLLFAVYEKSLRQLLRQ